MEILLKSCGVQKFQGHSTCFAIHCSFKVGSKATYYKSHNTDRSINNILRENLCPSQGH